MAEDPHLTAESLYATKVKRVLDLTLSALFLILFGPLVLVIAALVRVRMGTPVLFRQQRTGLHGKEFSIVKFRSMTNVRNHGDRLLSDSERITTLGRLLRKYSLDELPELVNVLRGDMSLVGPRPLLYTYRDRYSDLEFRRHDVRPGITGLAQVEGRNAISWERTFHLDLWYARNVSFMLDLHILLRTIGALIRPNGVVAEDPERAGELRPRSENDESPFSN